ncbi:MaoC family dehydratase [Nocardia asteroides]|uniref:MaoC family dehydratase n=1 Tax=Nocardia asteroides TaxID=1824 RepID=UPI001E4CF4C6|nr:MaoC family dehydratase [Nocardia asteroides]UGT62634.1 MaoC family dehydratase [Nocardia asteroides]
MTDTESAVRSLLDTDFSTPITDRWFEDYVPGATFEYGYRTVTEREILDFAAEFDPQPFHVDAGSAAAGPFGGLIASGWHSGSILMRIYADHYLSRVASLASPGIDELRWANPLRPGDSVRLRATVSESRRSRSKPDRGLVSTRAELLKHDGSSVVDLVFMNIIRCRPRYPNE